MQGPEVYECGRLKLVTGESGCGKTHAVKEWLHSKREDDGMRVVIVGFPEEYQELLWRRDVVVLSIRDRETLGFVKWLELSSRDVLVLDGSYPCEPGETADIIRIALSNSSLVIVTLQTHLSGAQGNEMILNLMKSLLADFGLMGEPSLRKHGSLRDALEDF